MSDIVTARIFSNGEVGITATKMNEIISRAVIQPDLIGLKPAASSAGATDYLLLLKSDNTLAKIAGDAFTNSVAAAVLPQVDTKIWNARLRSFNACGNPNFEIDQRNVGNTVANPVSNTPVIDRWIPRKVGTMVLSAGRTVGTVLVPGTQFGISNSFLRITLTTAQASLAAGDSHWLYQTVEGPMLRELYSDVHSASVLVRSTVAGLNFGWFMSDSPATKSLVKLCTIPSANTWTLIQMPNLPVAPAGNFTTGPGAVGYLMGICLASGTSGIAPANDTWQNGSFQGALGQDNFASKPVNSQFDIAFVQHEPGSQATTLIDKPFTQNYDECLRYYQKSYNYAVKFGTVDLTGAVTFFQGNATANSLIPIYFKKPMAKAPTPAGYSPSSGAAGAVRDVTAAADVGIIAYVNVGETGFGGFGLNSARAAQAQINAHYTADTGW